MIIGVYRFLSKVNKSSVNVFITTMNSIASEASTCTMKYFNLQTPNVNYSGRTAPLTSKVAFYIFIQQI